MPRRTRGSRKGQLWRGYRRPVIRDGVFWFALGVGVAGVAVQSPWSDWEGTTRDVVLLVVQVVLTFAAALVLVGVLAATVRGFGQGWREADDAAEPRPPADPVPPPRSAAQPDPEPVPRPEPEPGADRPAMGVAMEKKARVLGRAFGAARRTYREPD